MNGVAATIAFGAIDAGDLSTIDQSGKSLLAYGASIILTERSSPMQSCGVIAVAGEIVLQSGRYGSL